MGSLPTGTAALNILRADNERGPGSNANHGDGLSFFAEYRAFLTKGTPVRTHPVDEKNVFIYSELPEGYGSASNLPAPFTLHLINTDEMATGKSVTRIQPYGSSQSAIHVRRNRWSTPMGPNNNPIYGHAFGRIGQPDSVGVPNEMSHAMIYTRNISLGRKGNQTYRDAVTQTIGHEIGHHLNLDELYIADGITSIMITDNEYGDPSYTHRYASWHAPDYDLVAPGSPQRTPPNRGGQPQQP